MKGTAAILGAGAGGVATAVNLQLEGWRVQLWNRGQAALQRAKDGLTYRGALGSGEVKPDLVTSDMREALAGADVAIVCLPALAHASVAAGLAELDADLPVVLNPGHTCGALHFQSVFEQGGAELPPLAELSTLMYVARIYDERELHIGGVASGVRVATLPGGEEALSVATGIYPSLRIATDVLETSLSNVNMVLHPPGALLGAAWVEATGGDYLFYGEGMTPGVVRVLEALDRERVQLAASYGHTLPPLIEEMAEIGTADAESARQGSTREAISRGEANSTIKAPDSLEHRYYREDFGYSLLPLMVLAEIAGMAVPTAAALFHLAEKLLGVRWAGQGLGRQELGLEGADREDLMRRVKGDGHHGKQ